MSMTHVDLIKLRQILELVLDIMHQGNMKFGICYYINKMIDITPEYINFKNEVFSEWEYFSGNCNFPVPDPGGLYPEVAYNLYRDLSVGEYGKLRMHLLKYFIKRVDEELHGI